MKFRYLIILCLGFLAYPLAGEAAGPRPGEVVWTDGGSEGTVQGVFPDGRVSVKIGYGNYTFAQEQLARRGCLRQLCSGHEVVTNGGSRGTVNGVFYRRGTFSVKIGYGNYVFRFEDLAPANPPYNPYPPPPYGDVRVGDFVWTRSGSEGRVGGLFPNGDVSVQIGYGNYRFARADLAIRGCVYDLCSGQSVLTRSGSRGTVNGVFLDTQVSVKIGYGNYAFPYQDLARTYP